MPQAEMVLFRLIELLRKERMEKCNCLTLMMKDI